MRKGQQNVGSVSTGALAIQGTLSLVMNTNHVAMLGPFISSLQMQIFPLMMLDIARDEDLEEAGGILYFIATADILPDFILIPIT